MGNLFAKSSGGGWFGVKHQAPFPKIEVFTPSSENAVPTDNTNASIIFEAEAKGGNISHALLSYSFSEGVDDIEGAFSFSVEDENTDIHKGTSIFDAIPIRSIVKIYEGGSQPVFIGVVKRRSMSSSMTAQGPRRSIQFSGKSIISLISAYTVTTDLRICYVNPETESKKLTADLSKKSLNIKEFMKKTWEYYLEQGKDGSKAVVNKLIKDEIQLWIIGEGKGLMDSIETGESSEFVYPIVGQFFREGNNTITQIWRNVLASPVYELSAVCRNGKSKIVARESPFSEADWKNLDMYEIDPLDLISYDMSQSDEEVYNAFMGYLEGSAYPQEFYANLGAAQNDDVLEKIPEKIDIYGFKPLQVSFRGFDRQDMTQDKIKGFRKKLNQKTKYWFGRLDEMYTGTITLLTDFKTEQGDRNPKAGCKAKFLGGEFYIMRSDHKWSYGGSPTNTLTVSRGFRYDESGKQSAKLEGVGKRFKELG